MNTYLVTYQFRGAGGPGLGTYPGETVSKAVKPLEDAGARIISVILTSGN